MTLYEVDPVPEDVWYEDLRRRYRPTMVRVVFVGESAPDPGSGRRRFFYSEQLTHDNLFRGLMQALYGVGSSDLACSKASWLARFQQDGFWLLDVANRPVNRLSPRQRLRTLRDAAPAAIARIGAAAPSVGVIVCHRPAYMALEAVGVRDALTLLHDEPIPFPLGNWRRVFVECVRAALVVVGIRCPL